MAEKSQTVPPSDPCSEDEACALEFRRELGRAIERTDEQLAPVRRRTRQLKRAVGLPVEDTGQYPTVVLGRPSRPSRPSVVEEADPFPSTPRR